jgi:hypothetical protein
MTDEKRASASPQRDWRGIAEAALSAAETRETIAEIRARFGLDFWKRGPVMALVICQETRPVWRTPAGKRYQTKHAAYARHAWDLIRAEYFDRGDDGCCGSDRPCFYHDRSGYTERSALASPVEKLHYRLTRWLKWRDRVATPAPSAAPGNASKGDE